ncbi:uncharacterized protein LOC143832763 [Paroedura picta]|uniref:uncharacterized protein LOC143832763 n=1 Tax=Paroedura picta TaxID=143630 RepID=UPI004055C425
METLQLFPLCFLLLPIPSVLTQFQDFKCDENITAEIGEDINITCINNEKIIDVSISYNKTHWEISTFKNITTADHGRIALAININNATLHINSVQSSDQRMYHVFLLSTNGHAEKKVSLWVVDPVPSTSEKVVTEIPILEKLKSEETNHITVILVAIFALLVFGFAMAYCGKKKGVIKLPWGEKRDAYHQAGYPEDSF